MVDPREFVERIVKRSRHNGFYHFTDSRNLGSIRQHGLLSTSELRRLGLFGGVVAGGNDWSLEADARCGMDACVHLCFMDTHPMEYKARREGRIEQSTFLRVSPDVLLLDGVTVTADVANKRGVTPADPSDILKELDLQVIYARTDWKDREVQVRLKTAEKYEILVPTRIPPEMILNLGDG